VRIAIVTDFYYPSLGGITEHVDGQARGLTALGHEVTVVTGKLLQPAKVQDDALPVPEPDFEIARMGTALRLYMPLWGNGAETTHTLGPRLGRRVGAFFRSRGFDVVHVHAPYNPPFPAWAIEHTPYDALSVATFHSVFPQTLGMDIEAEWIRPAIERLDGRICVSEACIGSLTPYFPYAYDVIPNGIDCDHFTPDAEPVHELLGDHRNIVFVGRFDPRNGVDTMIHAHELLFAERGPAVRLIVVGDGPLRPLYERMISSRARPYVHFAGRLNRSRPNYLVTGDIFCTPCDRASFGMVLLEAMSCGRAVAASRISGFQLLMEHGKQGYLVHPAKSPEGFAEALSPLLDNPDLRGQMGAEGRRTALEQYSWPRVAEKLETYYSDLIAGRRPTWASAKSSASS
jgi:phosphatidyl-myo-inositol alpha-mannosyltransferase